MKQSRVLHLVCHIGTKYSGCNGEKTPVIVAYLVGSRDRGHDVCY